MWVPKGDNRSLAYSYKPKTRLVEGGLKLISDNDIAKGARYFEILPLILLLPLQSVRSRSSIYNVWNKPVWKGRGERKMFLWSKRGRQQRKFANHSLKSYMKFTFKKNNSMSIQVLVTLNLQLISQFDKLSIWKTPKFSLHSSIFLLEIRSAGSLTLYTVSWKY